MDQPTLSPARDVAPDTKALTTFLPLPGLGQLAINAYVIQAERPTLVDTGIAALSADFLAAVDAAVPLEKLEYIYLTHADADHTGALRELLERAPNAKLVTTYLGMGKLGLTGPVDPMRVYLMNPGQELDLGDRKLRALRPPTYDAPESTALFDSKTGTLFSADAFGAILPEPADDAAGISAQQLRDGMLLWASVDAPWLANVPKDAFDAALAAVRDLGARTILSAHLPPAREMTPALLENLAGARGIAPFVGPDQAAMMAMMAAAA